MSDATPIVILLDIAAENPISFDTIEPFLPQKRDQRNQFTLSELGVARTPRGAPADWDGCADALARMMEAARGRILPGAPPPHFYVAGRAALPVFAHLGQELSKWADVTIINRRADSEWDVIAARKAEGAPFFGLVTPLPSEPSDATGRVAVFISTARRAPRDAIRAFVTAEGDQLVQIVEVCAGAEEPALLTVENAPAAAAQLTDLFARIPRTYPHMSGMDVFLDVPAPLALMAGRAINTNIRAGVRIPNFVNGVYHAAVTLPWRGLAPPPLSMAAEDVGARKDILYKLIDEITKLKKHLRAEHMPGSLGDPHKQQLLKRIASIEVAREPGGEDFRLSVAERSLTFSHGLLEGVRQAPAAHQVKMALSFFLHEIFHFDQGLQSTTHHGVGRAGFVLEEIDYHADVFATYTLARLEISRRGEEGRERAREILTSIIDAGLSGIASFDRFEQGSRIRRFYERRLRRYLIWHLQRARAASLRSEEELWTLLRPRLVVELSLLRGEIDAQGDKIVSDAQRDTELMIALDGKLLRTQKIGRFDPRALISALRGFDRAAVEAAMEIVRDHHRAVLTPWVD
ncbi:MAG: hypothetical protein QM820_18735 [Minicystis sp.]